MGRGGDGEEGEIKVELAVEAKRRFRERGIGSRREAKIPRQRSWQLAILIIRTIKPKAVAGSVVPGSGFFSPILPLSPSCIYCGGKLVTE